ncbi:zincin-like metallopeptidase toxin domain-containing protein [Oceanirhabdus sp. W0125-5]|uniref:zincin-like metallopeptidase toxin domain-containing protein n=1 Tax=Oceanirhabdus sp. W0125-5 TaxID=2999116 RepID=UPI0022F30DCF|nr:zincin-like metallopeptidase toxin domain-containing protein [Oceanirhabdus sp. W0125-5]WBW96137.1 zincin-like metallopeptidase toxin domain-containing protein [Oceanirhabdus sp. W0125-5]
MKKKSIRILSIFLCLILFIEFNSTAVFALSENMERGKGKIQNKEIEFQSNKKQNGKSKFKPEKKEVKNERIVKIPPGLKKNEEKLERWKNKKEINEKRTFNSKSYKNDDGTVSNVIFLEPIHIKESGKFVDIKNNLINLSKNKNEKVYKNERGIFDVSFKNGKNNNPDIKIQKDGSYIIKTPKKADTRYMAVEGSQIIYGGESPLVDYLYTVNNTSVKEDIVLYNYTENNQFYYELNISEDLELKLQNNRILALKKDTKEVIFAISAPYMKDREGNTSEKLELTLEKKADKYEIKLTVDEEWLKDPMRVYPVSIDPTVKIPSGDIYDTYVQEGPTDYSQEDASMIYVGYDDGIASTNGKYLKKRTRGLIKFNLPAEIYGDVEIDTAQLILYKYTSWANEESTIYAYRTTEEFGGHVFWNDYPDNEYKRGQPDWDSGRPYASAIIKDPVGHYSWNINEIVQHWVENNDNNGLVLVMSNEVNQGDVFYSTDYSKGTEDMKPHIIINYKEKETEEPGPIEPPEAGELELIFERSGIKDNGTAYGKNTLEWEESEKNKAEITYRFMPDGNEVTITEEDFTSFQWETDKFEPEMDKAYWLEANVKVYNYVEPEVPEEGLPGEEGGQVLVENEITDEEGEVEGTYEEVLNETYTSNKFIVYQVQPGDTLRRIAKHYLDDGRRYTEIKELNNLQSEKLIVGQKLFIYTEKEEPLNYMQPDTVTKDMEMKDFLSGTYIKNADMVGQYINSNTGAFLYRKNDFSFNVYNNILDFTRSFSSTVENRKSPIGDSWDYSLNKYLFFYEDGKIGYNTGDGARIYYQNSGSNEYKPTIEGYEVLYDKGTYYELKYPDNSRYEFDKESGLLTSIKDRNNNEITVEYDNNHWQNLIKDPVNRKISFEYYTEGQWVGNIKRVSLPDRTYIEFSYEQGSNRLSTFSDMENKTTTYSYDSKGRVNNITLPERNTLLINTYDNNGRVSSQEDGEKNEVSLRYEDRITFFTDARDLEYEFEFNDKFKTIRKMYPDKKVENYIYDSTTGDLIKFIDRMRNTHNYKYNDLGYVTKYIKPNDKYTEYRYKNGYLTEYVKDFEGNEKRYYYDGNNNLDKVISYINENGTKKEVVTDYTFTREGLLSYVKDPDKVETFIDNSEYPRKQIIEDINKNKNTYYYDTLGRLTGINTPMNQDTKITYDRNGNIINTKYPGDNDTERYTSYTYDQNGNRKSETSSRKVDGSFISFEYDYDKNGRVKTITDPYLETVTYAYDGNGNVLSIEDQKKFTTKYVYNKMNQVKEVWQHEDTSPSVTYDYDAQGNIIKASEKDGDWTEYLYDYNRNKVVVSNSENVETEYHYNDMGALKKQILPDDQYISYTYDSLNRVTSIEEPGNKKTKIQYTDGGRVKTINENEAAIYDYEYLQDGKLSGIKEKVKNNTSSANNVSAQVGVVGVQIASLDEPITDIYDSLNIALALEESEEEKTSTNEIAVGVSAYAADMISYKREFTYDENGNLKTVKDEKGGITTYEYNELNKVSKVIDPLNNTIQYDYDEDGNVKKVTDGKNNETILQYDALNRTDTVRIPKENTSYSYFYDERGQLKHFTDPMGNTTTYDYDPRGRLKEVRTANEEPVKYSYYDDNNLKTILYPNGEKKEFQYDGLNRVTGFKDRAGIEFTIDYNVMSKPELVTDSVGNKTVYTYDQLGRVEKIGDVLGREKVFTYNNLDQVTAIKGMDSNITRYSYDGRGRVTEIIDPENKVTKIDYDPLNNVSTIVSPGDRVYNYEYDAVGNLTKIQDPLGNTREYKYDENNLVRRIINENGYSKEYTYDALNNLKTLTDERGNTTEYDYHPGGYLKTIQDPRGNKTQYAYNSLNKVESVTNALQETTNYHYDSMGRLDQIKDAKGLITVYDYNSNDALKSVVDNEGNSTIMEYYDNGDLWKTIDREGKVTEYEYDKVHRITKVKQPGGLEENFVYNAISGNIEKMYNNAGETTEYTYDSMHRLLSKTEEGIHTTAYTYDFFGNLKTKTMPDGKVTTYDYDELDRITSVIDPENKLTKIDYDPMGNIAQIENSNNITYNFKYDGTNNLTEMLDSLGNKTTYGYDENNNKISMIDPKGQKYQYNYDPLNRVDSIIDPNGNTSGIGYDKNGNTTSITDGNNNTTYYEYDNLNRLIKVQDPEGNITRYTYYKDGNLETMTDGNNNVSRYSYNEAGLLKKFTNPLGETKEFEYTLLGQVDKLIKGDGNIIDYEYDQFNRLDKIIYPDESTVEYAYDENDRKIAMKDNNGVSNYQYDDFGRLTYVSDYSGEEVSYQYDEKGRKTKLIYPDGKFVTYQYDHHDRMTGVIDREGRKTTYTYDQQGRRESTSLPNGITTKYEYDEQNRTKQITNTDQEGKEVLKLIYQYDGAGNKILEDRYDEDKHYRREYTYYKNNTVKSMVESGDNNAEYHYQYDGAGNITKKTIIENGESKTYTYEYNSANRMVTEKENGQITRKYRYDQNGNRTQRILEGEEKDQNIQEQIASIKAEALENGEEINEEELLKMAEQKSEVADYYYYNYENQLEEIVIHNGKVFTYGYDGEGNRLWRTYSQYPLVKPPVEEGERLQDPAEFPGYNKDNTNGKTNNGKGNENKNEKAKGKNKTTSYLVKAQKFYSFQKVNQKVSVPNMKIVAAKGGNKDNTGNSKDNGNSGGNNSGNSGGNSSSGNSDKEEDKGSSNDSEEDPKDNGNSSSKDEDKGNSNNNGNSNSNDNKDNNNGNSGNNDKENGNSNSNGNSSNNGNGNSNNNGNGNSNNNGNGNSNNNGNGNSNKENGNSNENKGNGQDKDKTNNGQDKNEKEQGKGWAKGKNKDKSKGNNGKHLGWYKNGKIDPNNPGDTQLPAGIDMTNPEVFEVTKYVNDINQEYTQVLMTKDKEDNYRAAYTYGLERIGVEDLVKVEGKPNNPLYYLQDAIGSTIAITNMNASIIDNNRFAPYGEPISPVAKNARLTNSYYGYTGEMHDIEGRMLYLRARYYDFNTSQFIQQDTVLGEIKNPLSRNLYSYAQGNPLKYRDPSGNIPILPLLIKAGAGGAADLMMQVTMNYFFNPVTKGDLDKSFDEVNWWQVGRSAAEALIPWKTPGGVLGKAAFAAVGDVMANALHQGSNYSRKKAIKDFAGGFIGDLIGSGIGKIIDKYGSMAVAKGLKKIGIDDDLIKKITGKSVEESTDIAEKSIKDATQTTGSKALVDNNTYKNREIEIYSDKNGISIEADNRITEPSRMLPESTAKSKPKSKPKSSQVAESSISMDNRLKQNEFFDNGERIATTKEIRNYKKQMKSKGIDVVVDKKGKILTGNKAAGFDYSKGTIYIQKKPGVIDLLHEGYHAEQFLEVGQKAYIELGSLVREEYVYSRIINNSHLFNEAELKGAFKYISKLRNGF